MRAAVIHAHGGPEVLTYEDVETPTAGVGEVLIKLEAAGINRFDTNARAGVVPYAEVAFPHVLGVEGAGTVAAVGAGVEAFRPGDRVAPVLTVSSGVCRHRVCYCAQGHDNICADFDKLGLTLWGTYAEYVKVNQHSVVHLPDAVSFTDAATALVAAATAWELARRVDIKPGETVLVNAAGGAVGSAGVQIAHLAGARVLASAGADDKLERARQLGADAGINYASHDLLAEVLRLTDGRGVDAVLETVGGEVLRQSLEALVPNGRLATAGSIGRAKTEIDIYRLLRKQVWMTGTHFAPKQSIRDVLALLAEGKLRPVLAASLPLAEARAAHELLESRQFFGNIVLTVG
jgi:NADPH:quinone reductase-like Zn-dependent oxidoreductase